MCASQNLLQGVIKDPDLSSAEVGIEDAISTASELLFYMEPLSEDDTARGVTRHRSQCAVRARAASPSAVARAGRRCAVSEL